MADQKKAYFGQVACPHCAHPVSEVKETQKTRRRRRCASAACAKNFTTYERYADHTFRRPQDYPTHQQEQRANA